MRCPQGGARRSPYFVSCRRAAQPRTTKPQAPHVTAPKDISTVDKAAFANRTWDARMVRFLDRQRRQGKPIRWIAEKLGVTLVRAVAEAINRGLVMHTAYRGRRCLTPPTPDLEPLGQVRDLPDENLCHYMQGHPTGAWRMCARPTQHATPWCPHHRARVYVTRAARLPGSAGILPALAAAPPHEEPAGSRRSQARVTP